MQERRTFIANTLESFLHLHTDIVPDLNTN